MNRQLKKKGKCTIRNKALMCAGASLFVLTSPKTQASWFPYLNARTQLQGSFVTQNHQFMGDIDSLLPTLGSKRHFIFTDFNSRYSVQNGWFIAPGMGLRGVFHNQIFGVYGFADYEQTKPAAHFWVANPGIEWMTSTLDAHVNAYLPTKKSQQIGNPVFANTTGDFSRQVFTGHNHLDVLYNPIVSIGNGVDAEAGYSFDFKNYRARTFTGYYYYGNEASARPVRGVLAGIQLPINKDADLLFTDSYNNITHNTVALTLRISFGANRQFSKDVQDRLLDRVERHNGIITTGAGAIAQKSFADTGQLGVFRSNLWFFEPTVPPVQSLFATSITVNECTYEHPCNNFSQNVNDQINTISPFASLYFAPGNYPLSIKSPLNVFIGQSLYGRTAGYQSAALGDDRALFTGALQLQGENYLDSLRVFNNQVAVFNDLYFGQGLAALFVPNINNRHLWLNNMELSVDAPAGTTNFAAYNSALIATSGIISINHSTLSAYNAATDMNNSVSASLHLLGTAQATVNNSSIIDLASGRAAYGAISFNTSKFTLNNSTITTVMDKNGEARGLEVRDFSQGSVSNTIINATSSGLHAWGALSNQNASLSLENGSINAIMEGTGEAQGLNIRGFSQMTLKVLSITAKSSGTASSGAYLTEDGKLDMSGGQINTMMTGAGVASGLSLHSRSYAKLANQVTLTTSSIGTFAIGAQLRDNSSLNLSQSTLTANMMGQGEADGINLADSSKAILQSNTVHAISSGALVFGSVTHDNSVLSFDSGTITANMQGSGSAFAINLLENSNATFTSSNVQATSSGQFAMGVITRNNSILTFNSGTIAANMTGQGEADGINTQESSRATFANNTVQAISSGTLAFGTVIHDTSILTFSSGSINANMLGQGTATGVSSDEQSSLLFNGSTILVNNDNPQAQNGVGIIKNGSSSIQASNIILNVNGAQLTQGTNSSDFSGANQCTLNGQTVPCS